MNDTKFDWQLLSSLTRVIRFAHEFIRQMWHWVCNWQRATPKLHVQNKLLVCSIGCWLFRFSILHYDQTVNTIIF